LRLEGSAGYPARGTGVAANRDKRELIGTNGKGARGG
jgi:hypothetical protein